MSSSDGKEGKGKKRRGSSLSEETDLTFPAKRVHKQLKNDYYAKRVSPAAGVYCAAVLEYLVAEVVEMAGNAARNDKKARITPRHIQLAVQSDHEFSRLTNGATISRGGVTPNINAVLLPKKKLPTEAKSLPPVSSSTEVSPEESESDQD